MAFEDLAVVTVSTRNYLHRVRSLFSDVEKFLPGALRLACSVDAVEGFLDAEEENYELFEACELGIPRYEQLVFALNPTAVCCALKPYAVLRALEHPGIKRVLYIDNDMALYRRPDELLESLSRHSFVLTPHHLAPLPEGASPDEMTLIPYGIYNAGMFAVTNETEAVGFLRWWADWMSDPRHVVADWAYDQIWLNYVPVYCCNVGTLFEEGYNVAFWNFAERNLHKKDGAFFCGERPLVAFHFSTFNDNHPERIVGEFLECDVVDTEVTRELCLGVADSWKSHGRDQCLAWGYQYRSWHDGEPVSENEREYVRDNWDTIDSDLGLWSATLQQDQPELFSEMRAQYLADASRAKKDNKRLLSGLLDVSPRKVLRKVWKVTGDR